MFVRRLKGKPAKVENIAEPRQECGHSSEHLYRYEGETRCRKCIGFRADMDRARRLPDMIETTRAKLAGLEREAKRRGQIV